MAEILPVRRKTLYNQSINVYNGTIHLSSYLHPLVTNALFVYFGCCLHSINIQHATHDGLKRASAVNSTTEHARYNYTI